MMDWDRFGLIIDRVIFTLGYLVVVTIWIAGVCYLAS